LTEAPEDPRIGIAEHLYTAIAAGEIEEALRWAHPEIVLDWSRSRGPYQGVYERHEGARDFIREAVAVFRDVEYFTDDWIEAGDRLVRIGGIRGIGRQSGVEISGRGSQIFEFENGLVRRVTLFQSPDEALAAAGAD
jgi:ketosteroid isomerase-like protein